MTDFEDFSTKILLVYNEIILGTWPEEELESFVLGALESYCPKQKVHVEFLFVNFPSVESDPESFYRLLDQYRNYDWIQTTYSNLYFYIINWKNNLYKCNPCTKVRVVGLLVNTDDDDYYASDPKDFNLMISEETEVNFVKNYILNRYGINVQIYAILPNYSSQKPLSDYISSLKGEIDQTWLQSGIGVQWVQLSEFLAGNALFVKPGFTPILMTTVSDILLQKQITLKAKQLGFKEYYGYDNLMEFYQSSKARPLIQNVIPFLAPQIERIPEWPMDPTGRFFTPEGNIYRGLLVVDKTVSKKFNNYSIGVGNLRIVDLSMIEFI